MKPMTNDLDITWSGVLPLEVILTGTEKRLLEAIRAVQEFGGVFQDDMEADDGTPDVSDELERLCNLELIESDTVGETFTDSGRSRHDGHDVYRVTDRGRQWLAHCRPLEPRETNGTEAQKEAAQ